MVAREMIFLGGNRPANGAGPVERVVQTGFRAADGEEMAEVVENIPF
jgi:hypothetical protein